MIATSDYEEKLIINSKNKSDYNKYEFLGYTTYKNKAQNMDLVDLT